MKATEFVTEKWSDKYKRSINCSNPKGFSQKAHCAGRKKNESVTEAKESIKDQIEKAVIVNGGDVNEYFVRSANVDKLGYSAKQKFGRSPDTGDDDFSVDYIGTNKGKPALWFYPLSYYLKNATSEAYANDMPHVWLVRIKPNAWLQPVANNSAVKQPAPNGKERVGILRKSAVPAAIFFKPAFDVVDKFYDYGSQHKRHGEVKGVAESAEQVAIAVRKGRNKFATEMTVNGEPAGSYQYDANTGRSIAEVDPKYKGKGYGKILVLHAIYTAAMSGMDFVEDESRTSEYDNVLDSLDSNGYAINDDGYWYVTEEGEQFLKQALKQGVAEGKSNDTAISLSRLGKFHPGEDTLAEFVPERATAQYALHPDKWESTFYSLTNKDSDKVRYYGPKEIAIPPGTLVGDMAIANKFYRAKTTEEKQHYAEMYRQSLKPYPVDVSGYRMPELLIPKFVAEYSARGRVGTSGPIKLGNLYKDSFPVIKTPISHLYEVRIDNNSPAYPEYYFYNKDTGACVGQFALDAQSDAADDAAGVVKPGVMIVQPHITLAPEVQGKGLGLLIYRTFLSDGNRVFATYGHSKGAGALWNRVATGDIVSVLYSADTKQVVDPDSKESRFAVRLLGHKNKFKVIAENFADGKKPGRKGLAKRMGVDCSKSETELRKIARNSSGERQRMAHWCANMKKGKQK